MKEKVEKWLLDEIKKNGIPKEIWYTWKEQDINEEELEELLDLNNKFSLDISQILEIGGSIYVGDNVYPKADGTGEWLVFYRYEGPFDDKNRDFCAEVLTLDSLMTQTAIETTLSNPEFGNYSIWDYKGSYGCRHRWRRNIFFFDYEDQEFRKVGNVPNVVAKIDDNDATSFNDTI